MPVEGLEPTLPYRETDFESVASANSATPARALADSRMWLRGGQFIPSQT